METYLARQTRRSNEQRAKFLLDGWDDTTKPALEAIEKATLSLLHALDMARSDLMRANDIAAIDAFSCDVAGPAIDVLRALRASQCRELEDCDGNPSEMRLDLCEIEDEHNKWESRWNARKPT